MARKKKGTSELVQIQKSPIPPLRQSTEETMACPRFYVEVFIKGRKTPSGMDAARGTEIHATMAAYLSYCATKKVGMDLDAFEKFSRGAGPQAYKILSGLRDGYVVDWNHLFATEITMSLDEHLQPTNVAKEAKMFCKDSGLPVVHQGTLDGVYVLREENHVIINDFKSHVRPFDPDDKPQGKKYALLAFQHFPWAEKVTFCLTFVRYKNLNRSVEYTRDQLPMLVDVMNSSRSRQEILHEKYDNGGDIEAIPGSHCIYCPLLSDRTCPISEFNQNMQLDPVDRLKFNLWYSAFSRVNNTVLKDYVSGTGKNVILRDYNGKSYIYGAVESESTSYPLFEPTADGISMDREGNPVLPIVSLLLDYAHASPDDTAWMGKLSISSTKLNSALGAKKRSFLDQACQDASDKSTKVTLKVSKPLDALPSDNDDEEGKEWGDEGEDF